MWKRWPAGALALLGLLSLGAGAETPAAESGLTLVTVVVDSSGSLREGDLALARDLAMRLIAGLPAGSELAVFSFDDQSRLVLARTPRAEEVRAAIARVRRGGRHTALHDALYDASRYAREAPVGRRAIVLVTDGQDENSTLTLEDGLRVAQEGRIPVFTVGVGAVRERVLRRIAKLTGGEYLPGPRARAAPLAQSILALPSQGLPDARAGATPRAGPSVAPRPTDAARGPAAGAGAGARPAVAAEPGRRGGGAAGWLIGLAALTGTAVLFLVFRGRRAAARCPSCGRQLPDALSSCAFCGRREERPRPSPDTTLRTDLSPTVMERLNSTEEYLEKTVTLRERPVLTITQGPGTGELFELSSASATSIGRARANDIILKDVSISGQHCRIRPEDGGFVLHDLKSTNGVFVNDKRVSRHTLADGDLVQIGETVMQFRTEHRRV